MLFSNHVNRCRDIVEQTKPRSFTITTARVMPRGADDRCAGWTMSNAIVPHDALHNFNQTTNSVKCWKTETRDKTECNIIFNKMQNTTSTTHQRQRNVGWKMCHGECRFQIFHICCGKARQFELKALYLLYWKILRRGCWVRSHAPQNRSAFWCALSNNIIVNKIINQ